MPLRAVLAGNTVELLCLRAILPCKVVVQLYACSCGCSSAATRKLVQVQGVIGHSCCVAMGLKFSQQSSLSLQGRKWSTAQADTLPFNTVKHCVLYRHMIIMLCCTKHPPPKHDGRGHAVRCTSSSRWIM